MTRFIIIRNKKINEEYVYMQVYTETWKTKNVSQNTFRPAWFKLINKIKFYYYICIVRLYNMSNYKPIRVAITCRYNSRMVEKLRFSFQDLIDGTLFVRSDG